MTLNIKYNIIRDVGINIIVNSNITILPLFFCTMSPTKACLCKYTDDKEQMNDIVDIILWVMLIGKYDIIIKLYQYNKHETDNILNCLDETPIYSETIVKYAYNVYPCNKTLNENIIDNM